MTSATKDKPLSAQPRHGFLYLVAVIASLSGLLFGYDTGVVSGALLFLKTQYHLSPIMQEVVTAWCWSGPFSAQPAADAWLTGWAGAS